LKTTATIFGEATPKNAQNNNSQLYFKIVAKVVILRNQTVGVFQQNDDYIYDRSINRKIGLAKSSYTA